MSKIIKTISPETNIIGNKNSPRSGAFEVKLDDKTIYSKFSTNTFPNEEDINSWFI